MQAGRMWNATFPPAKMVGASCAAITTDRFGARYRSNILSKRSSMSQSYQPPVNDCHWCSPVSVGALASPFAASSADRFFLEYLNRPRDRRNGCFYVRVGMDGRGHAAQARKIDAVQQHAATKRMHQTWIPRPFQLVERAAI